MKRGLKELGEKGETAMSEDLYQIHMRDTFRPKSSENLTEEKNRDALESLKFLMFKRDRIVKGQT